MPLGLDGPLRNHLDASMNLKDLLILAAVIVACALAARALEGIPIAGLPPQPEPVIGER